jgi:hypothetical protein
VVHRSGSSIRENFHSDIEVVTNAFLAEEVTFSTATHFSATTKKAKAKAPPTKHKSNRSEGFHDT